MLKRASGRYSIDCSDDVDLTDQQFVGECDIRSIIDRYRVTGQMPRQVTPDMFGDVSKVQSFTDACLLIQQAEEEFADYPARVRDRFDNDPAVMLEWLSDPQNMNEAVDLGILPVESLEAFSATQVAEGGEKVITSPAESPQIAPSGVVE